MKIQTQPSDDGRLRALLRESRPAPPLPPRFQESVWHRIEHAQAPSQNVSWAEWLDRAAAWLLRPRLALAGVAAMLLVGISIGVLQGGSLANELAKQQYLAAVSPLTTR
jgi:hypothetical protein